MTVNLTPRDLSRLDGVHPDLIAVVKKAAEITTLEFFVIEGLRTLAAEQAAISAGKSQTLKSRHLTGFAVDLGIMLNGALTWGATYYTQLNEIMMDAAKVLNIPLEWGGDWKTLADLDHWQLPHDQYPDPQPTT